MRDFLLAFTLLNFVLPIHAFAQNSNATINFSGTVDSTCNVVVSSPSGTLRTSPSLRQITSREFGGTPGQVEIATTGGISIAVDAPVIGNIPSSDTTFTEWRSSYRSATIAGGSEQDASVNVADAGTYDVDVHLTGTKAAPDTFHAGTYSATVTVRCEPQ